MAGASWLVDSKRIATKIRSASGAIDPREIQWKSNPSKSCPNCHYVMDNSDVPHAWPGLPRGVKFDPTDQEIIWHLLAKVGIEDFKPHPFIDEFISTVEEEDGICYTHPQNMSGVKQDGSMSHFFHRAIKAYSTGTRKRRKIHGDDSGDVRWHKTGRTKPVLLDGAQKGCKKIMVLYVSPVKGGKAEKTNWVMHQYHLGTGEDEKEGQFVISKIFYQQQVQLTKQIERGEEEISEAIHTTMAKVDPLTPKSATPKPRVERRFSNYVAPQDSTIPPIIEHHENIMEGELKTAFEQTKGKHHNMEEDLETAFEQTNDQHHMEEEPGTAFEQTNDQHHILEEEPETAFEETNIKHHNNVENVVDQVADNSGDEDLEPEMNKWWENESQYLLNSQQLVEAISLYDDILQSQSPPRHETGNGKERKGKALLSDYARLGPEQLKRDLEECQNIASDPAMIDLDTPPDFRESQLEFGSQDSYIAWGGSFQGGKMIESESQDRVDLS